MCQSCLVVWVQEVLTCPSLPALPGLRRRPSTRSAPPRHSCCGSPPTWHHTARGVHEGVHKGVGGYVAIRWQRMLHRCAQHVSRQNISHTYIRTYVHMYSVTHPPPPQSPSPASVPLPRLSPPPPPQSPSPASVPLPRLSPPPPPQSPSPASVPLPRLSPPPPPQSPSPASVPLTSVNSC